MAESGSASERETITTYELLERSARAALELQRDDGSFPPGRNNVYDENETPVRTTSKWLITLSAVLETTGDEKIRSAAEDALEYLLSDEARPCGYSFHSRTTEDKNFCDGLVGQSGPITSLIHAGELLERSDAIQIASEIFHLHPFDARLGLWERIEIDGTNLSFDRTLNHQIFFAGGGATVANHDEAAHRRVETFLDRLSENIQITKSGRLRHLIKPPRFRVIRSLSNRRAGWNLVWNDAVATLYHLTDKQAEKELGYQLVNLRGLATLKKTYPDHPVWDNEQIQRSIEYVVSGQFEDEYDAIQPKYGTMVPMLSLARALDAFGGSEQRIIECIETALNRRFDPGCDLLVCDTIDPNYQAAEISNLTSLPNLEVSLRFNANSDNVQV